MNKKKVLILSYSHLYSDSRIQRQIRALKNNFQIETVGYSGCGDTNIPFYSIYAPPPFSLKRKLKRFIQYSTQKFDDYYWNSGNKNLTHKLRPNNYDVIIANDIYTLPLALAIADNKGKVYFDAHEYHPREFEDNFKWRFFHKPYIQYLCKVYIPKANTFSTVCDGIAKEYQAFIGMMPYVITNATYYSDIQPAEIINDKIKLIHHGAAIPGRQIENMIDMMKQLGGKYSLFLMLTGKGSKYYNELVNHVSKCPNVFFLDPVPYNEIVTTINKYDLGLYCLPPSNFNNQFALPNKFFEFIQARLCIAVSPSPEMEKLVKAYDLGVISENFSSKAMADAIKGLTKEKIMHHKRQSHLYSKILSAEENLKKINDIVTCLTK